MAHSKNCITCGKDFQGNINRRFCSDACRKYYQRHGGQGHSGLSLPDRRDAGIKSGQSRTSTRSSVGDYAFKKAIDLAGKIAEKHMVGPAASTAFSGMAGITGKMPLQTATLVTVPDLGRKMGEYRPSLTPALRRFLGELTHPFQVLIWGLPGSGKSTMSMVLADQMAALRKVLYISGEESLSSATLRQKQARTITRPTQFLFVNRLPDSASEWYPLLFTGMTGATSGQLAGNGLLPALFAAGSAGQSTGQLPGVVPGRRPDYQTVVYDSITMLGVHPFHVKATANDLQLPSFREQVSHVFISHAHKDGKEYRGDGSWGHEVDIIIRCHEGTATIQKNRFATATEGRIGSEYKIY